MPDVGIVCADARVADIEEASTSSIRSPATKPKVEDALSEIILDAFGVPVHGLGSLLDVRGTLGDLFMKTTDRRDGWQLTLGDDPRSMLGQVLQQLREAVDEHQDFIRSLHRTCGAF